MSITSITAFITNAATATAPTTTTNAKPQQRPLHSNNTHYYTTNPTAPADHSHTNKPAS